MIKQRLRKTWDRTRSVPGLGKDLTVIAGLVVLGLIFAGVILAKQRVHWPWQDELTFQADFRNAPGIAPGNGQEVRIAGVTVGRITEADITDEGHARLTLAIDPDYEVYHDTRLVLRPKTPLNDMYVEMSQGDPASGEVEEGDLIGVAQTEDPVQIDEVLKHLDERTRNAMTSLLAESDVALANAPQDLPAGLDAASATLTTFKPLAESLQTRRETIAALVTSLSQIARAAGEDDERLRRLVQSLSVTLGTMSEHDKDVRRALEELPGLTSALRGATSSVVGLSRQLDPTLRNLSDASTDLPSALRDLSGVAKGLEDFAVRARPVTHKLQPIAADLRPVVADLRPASTDARDITQRLDNGTGTLVSYLTQLQAFVYNTASIVSLQDANSGILRGQVAVNPATLPDLTGGNN